MNAHRIVRYITTTAALAALSACGGGESSVSDVNSFISSGNSTSSCSSRYKDLVTTSTRTAAKNDSQCGYYVANADSYLEATKAACAQGEMGKADDYYDSTYTKAASYANTAVQQVCGSGSASTGGSTSTGGSSSNTSSGGIGTYYVLYVKRSSTSGAVLSGSCSNGSMPSDGSGYYWMAAGSYTTMSACKSAGSSYGLTFP
jgi:hypothetical protein